MDSVGVSVDALEECVGEAFEFLGADAFDVEHVVAGGRFEAGHVAEGGVGEDDVCGDVVLLGDFASEVAQALEELVVDAFPVFGVG